ncbi:MerR family transcriptional regulator [Streptomyces sp. NPDC051985]|uniref:helix-turn-helix domain-containing protein n=1 Tax=Streptomyces sp. NPDC051985 TaxID=3155807 RepID=UPI00342980D2
MKAAAQSSASTADEGVVPHSNVTEGGFRRYDVQAIARLELVRTLRDLGAGLDGIRRVLAAETTLHELAATHLRLVVERLRQFRARRAVLRTIVRQHTMAERVSLMYKLVSMSDEDRDRLIDGFWNFVTDGLDVHPAYVEQLHGLRPLLSEVPSAEQLEALDRARRDRAGRGVPHGAARLPSSLLRHRAGQAVGFAGDDGPCGSASAASP